MSGFIVAKAAAIMAQGRLVDLAVDPDGRVTATVITDTARRHVIRTAAGVWCCDCPAWTWRLRCSHQLAVARLVAAEGNRRRDWGLG